MTRPRLEVADVLRAHGHELVSRGQVSSAKRRVIADLLACRTSVLGGHVDRCRGCGHVDVSYNSCRNRHCPKCQGLARAAWVDAQQRRLLPVPYFHVVFTLPDEIAELALQNKRVLYGLLMRASAETLQKVAADPRHLGAQIGFVSVLHTWSQTLRHHPHVHTLVPGGGLSDDGSRWVVCRPGFFLPVRVLSRVFRGKFLAGLKQLYECDRLRFQGHLEPLNKKERFAARLARVRAKEWVVYAKPPFGGPERVLRYLARYTHRVAIANSRLVSLEDGRVTFDYRDRTHHDRSATMCLPATEFLRRFLLHVLPKGFVRIRHYGLLANRSSKLARCRQLLDAPEPEPVSLEPSREPDTRCPRCGSTDIERTELPSSLPVPRGLDSS